MLQCGVDAAQAAEEPAGVVLDHLRLAALLRLEASVAQQQGLREGQGGLAEVQPVQPSAEV
ncbi:hypothetical protein D3C80_2046050 [compost metagenome]